MEIKHITTEDLRKMSEKEGLVLQGCGGDPKEWVCLLYTSRLTALLLIVDFFHNTQDIVQ